jgi:hypothetical protein
MGELIAFVARDGTSTFTCVDCNAEVISFGKHDRKPVCGMCLLIRDIGERHGEQAASHLKTFLAREN